MEDWKIMKLLNHSKNENFYLDKRKIHVICIPYQYNPNESFSRSVKIVKYFREVLQIYPYSPILETHPYHVECRKMNPNHDDDYYDWDLHIYDAMKPNVIMIFTLDWENSKGCKIEMEWAKSQKIPIGFIKESD